MLNRFKELTFPVNLVTSELVNYGTDLVVTIASISLVRVTIKVDRQQR